MLNIKVVTWSLAIWTTFTFVFCVVYGLLTPSSEHMYEFLEQILPGFEWLSWQGFFVGLVKSFLYGAYAGLVYVPIYNFLQRKWNHAIDKQGGPRNEIERTRALDLEPTIFGGVS